MKPLQPAITVLLLICLLMPGHIVRAVLCIRADGHITFEAAANGRCGSLSAVTFEHLPEQIADFSSSTDHHGPCIDVPFFARAEAEVRPRVFTLSAFPKLQTPMVVLVPFVMSVDAESLQRDFVFKPPSFASTLTALRTVVLLL